jgi:hypothetical protein
MHAYTCAESLMAAETALMSSSPRDLPSAADELGNFRSSRRGAAAGAAHPRRQKNHVVARRNRICEHGVPNPARPRGSPRPAGNLAHVSLSSLPSPHSRRTRRRLSLAVLRRVRRDPGVCLASRHLLLQAPAPLLPYLLLHLIPLPLVFQPC